MEFITIAEFEKVRNGDVVILNEVFSRVFNKAVETALQMTPELTATLIKNGVAMQKMKDTFYDANPDIIQHKDIIKEVAKQVELEHPGWTYKQILYETATRVREKVKQMELPLQ